MKLLELFIDVSVRGSRAVAGLNRVERKAAQTERSLAGVGRGATAVIGRFAAMAGGAYAVGRAIGSTVRAGMDFEKQMNSVGAIAKQMGATDAQLQGLNDKARQLGRETEFSATQAAGALETLLKNGVSVEKILGGMADASLTLAGAMSEGIAPSADLLTDVMAQFKLEAKDAATAIDIIAGASVASKFNMQQLWQAYSKAGAQANDLGIDMAEYSAIISMVASNFKTGEEAGTGFRGFLTKLTGISGPARKKMKALGLEFFDTKGQLKEFPDILKELNEGLGDLSDEARTTAIAEIFGLESMPFVNALLGQTGDQFKEIREQIAATSAQKLKTDKFQGLAAEMKEAGSALESLMITISTSGINAFLESVVRGFTEIVRSIDAWITKNPELIQNITDIVAAIAPWIGALVALMFTVAALRMTFGLFFRSTLVGMVAWVAKMIAQVTGLTAALSVLGNKLPGGKPSAPDGPDKKPASSPSRFKGLANAAAGFAGRNGLKLVARTPITAVIAGPIMLKKHRDNLNSPEGRERAVVAHKSRMSEYQKMAEMLVRTGQLIRQMDGSFTAPQGNTVVYGPEVYAAARGLRPRQTGGDAGLAEQVTNNNTVNVGGISVQVETQADANQIAAAVDARMQQSINGAMLEANN